MVPSRPLWIVAIAATLLSSGETRATSPAAVPSHALNAPACFDTDGPDGKRLRGTGWPVHHDIARHLALLLRTVGQSADFRCAGVEFSYLGSATATEATVESRYLRSGVPHAKATYIYSKERGGFISHGVTRASWPNGKPQSIEYYCNGLPVGFHRYFNTAGKLLSVADHTRSDYRAARNLQGSRNYFDSNGSSHGGPQPDSGPLLFRQLFDIHDGKASPVGLHTRGRYSSFYVELDPASRVEQWVTAGNQGQIRLDTRLLTLVNTPMDYAPFRETYQRSRSGMPGLEPVVSHDQEILACPWVHEAMTLPPGAAALALPAVAPLSDEARQVTPRVRYLACMDSPSAACLLEFGARQVTNEESHRQVFQEGAALVALRLGRPDIVLEQVQAQIDLYAPGATYPFLAVPEINRAEALIQLGLANQSRAAAERSFAHANRIPQAHEVHVSLRALAAIGPELARLGFRSLAVQALERLESEGDVGASRTRAAIGLADAMTGRNQEANALALQLRDAAANERVPQGPARPARADGWLTPNAHHVRSLALIAVSLARAGDTSRASAILQRAQDELSRTGVTGDRSDMDNALASAFAALGDTAMMRSHLRSPDSPETMVQVATVLCKGPAAAQARELLGSAKAALPTSISTRSAVQIASLARAYLDCGLVDEGRELLTQAYRHAADTPHCAGDVCGGIREYALATATEATVESGQLDLLEPRMKGVQPNHLHITWAVRQAEQGDVAGAIVRINTLKAMQPNPLTPVQRVKLRLAEARIASLRHDTGLRQLLNHALADASAIDGYLPRAEALLDVARASRTLGDKETALRTLLMAREHHDATVSSSANLPGMYYTSAQFQLGLIAQEFAANGAFDEADLTSRLLLMPVGTLASRSQASRWADQIDIALLLRSEPPVSTREKLRMLNRFPHSLIKLQALEALLQRPDMPVSAAAEAAREHAAQTAAYLLASADGLERRQSVSVLAQWLRRFPQSVDAKHHFDSLLVETRRTSDAAWQARMLCELGFTAKQMGSDTWQEHFDKGVALAATFRIRTFPLDPPPAGGCAFWLRQAGEHDKAERVMDAAIYNLRDEAKKSHGMSRHAYAGHLLGLAIAYAEAASGEIAQDWRRMFWR